MTCCKPPHEIIDAILFQMATHHPHLSEAEEAALKSRLFAIVAGAEEACIDPDHMARLYREATAAR
ncbi:hypothetical protein [Emcibacter sp. SYSU 3D8]|uniref:hypothetical protein n=1 Tax=Emcibacter sp. SYSU 3D8 TaxID=3133969 RepID=UPI0031FF14CC